MEELKKSIKEKENADKLLLKVEVVLGFITLFSFLALYSGSLYLLSQNLIFYGIVLTVLAWGVLVFGVSYCLIIEQKAGYYECGNCKHKYVPTFKAVLCAMHIGRSRYMKCPHCGQKSWNKKVISKE